jgi:uncharacterized membrane protein
MTTAVREGLAARGLGRKNGFRWRGQEVSRIEALSDAVFAFAVTLLVVSLEVPRTFDELAAAMRGFIVFAVCFALLIEVWREHYTFFRRYGLQDNGTIWLNAALLFVTLFYVYPLKFLFGIVFRGWTGSPAVIEEGGHVGEVIRDVQVPSLFLIYGAGVIALYLILALMYRRALGKREELALTPLEVFDTKTSIVMHVIAAAIGVLSCVIAVTVPLRLAGLAGYVYFLFGPAMAILGSRAGRRRRQLEAALS